MVSLLDMVMDPDASMTDRVRCTTSLFAMHAGMFALRDVEGDPEEKRKATLEVAVELMTQAHHVTP